MALELHTLQHALDGCYCTMKDIDRCVICHARLPLRRTYADVCNYAHFRELLAKQRVHGRAPR